MKYGSWKSIKEPPVKNGHYMVKFYFKDRHETDRTEIVFRDFENGEWTPSYCFNKNDGGELIAWRENV